MKVFLSRRRPGALTVRVAPRQEGVNGLDAEEHGSETSELQLRTMKRVAARLMPALLVLYVIAYLDRVNVTFAQDQLE